MTAVRRPYRAAATATLVALPPSHLPKVSTLSRPTPTCSGYRSALTRPMVRTSKELTRASPGTRQRPARCPECRWLLLLRPRYSFYARFTVRSRVCPDIFTYGGTGNLSTWCHNEWAPDEAAARR